MSAPDDDEDAIVVDWQRGWEPTPDDDPPPPSQWHDTPPPSGDWRTWTD